MSVAAEGGDADGDPDRLPAAVLGVEAVDRDDPEHREHGGEREERAVGVRHRPPYDDVRDEVEGEEERAPRDRARRDLGVAGDRDARERDAREQRRDDQPGELAAARTHRVMPQYRTRRPTTTTIAMKRDRREAPPGPAPCVRTSASAADSASAAARRLSGGPAGRPSSARPRARRPARPRRARRGRR